MTQKRWIKFDYQTLCFSVFSVPSWLTRQNKNLRKTNPTGFKKQTRFFILFSLCRLSFAFFTVFLDKKIDDQRHTTKNGSH